MEVENKKSAFNDLIVVQPTPLVNLLAVNGPSDQIDVNLFGTGAFTTANSKFNVSTGTTVGSFASMLSLEAVPYKSGLGIRVDLSAKFTTGVANSQQLAGFVSATDGPVFGYNGATFGIFRRHDGVNEIQELQFTTPSSGSENATITINGDALTVPLTAGTVQHNAREAADSLTAQSPLFRFSSNDDTVVVDGLVAQASVGAFTFSSGTAVAAFTQLASGALTTDEFVAQAAWNRNPMPDLNPQMLNVYSIQAQYLGAGDMMFYIRVPGKRDLELVHVIEYPNTATVPSLGDPTMRVGIVSASLGSTTDLSVESSSIGGFIDGVNTILAKPTTFDNTLVALGTTLTNLITVRCRNVRGVKANRSLTHILRVSGFTDSNKGAVIQVVRNATVAGDPDFSYEDKVNSIIETDTSGTTVTGGTIVAELAMGPSGSDSIDLDIRLAPSETITLSAAIISGSTADVTGSVRVVGDI